MAKIDVTTIAGYEEMSVEDKLKALESFEYDDGSSAIKKLKESVSNASSQAAEWKRKHNDLLSEEEKAKQSRDEEFAMMKAKLESLEKEKTIATYTAKFAELGYDGELASDTASAMADGDIERVLTNQKKYNELYEKQIKANLLKATPTPQTGVGDKKITREQFDKMDYQEMMAFKQDDPELFKQFTS